MSCPCPVHVLFLRVLWLRERNVRAWKAVAASEVARQGVKRRVPCLTRHCGGCARRRYPVRNLGRVVSWFERGLLSEVKGPITDLGPYRDRKLVQVEGRPLSEVIIEERR